MPGIMSRTNLPQAVVKIAIFAALISVGMVDAGGCATARRDELVSRTTSHPTSRIALGERVFMAQCNQCHPGGAAGLGPAINNTPGFLIEFQVRHGLGNMPRFSRAQISDRQLDAVVAYLKDLGHRPVTLARSS